MLRFPGEVDSISAPTTRSAVTAEAITILAAVGTYHGFLTSADSSTGSGAVFAAGTARPARKRAYVAE
jgi:hypothetical protein